MTRMASLLAWRSLWDQPRRTLALLAGYGIGVAVMIALLSVGDALLAQAQDRDLVAGGDLVLLPEGVDPAVLKVNGVTDLYFTIQQAGFVVREILGGGRFGTDITAAAPQIDSRQVYVRTRGTARPALASGGIPSLDRAAHATRAVPRARDTAADREWIAPPPALLIDRLDRFHTPPRGTGPAWAEWDYFNFTDPQSRTYGYLTVLAGGEGRGGILARIKRPGRPVDDIQIRAGLRPGDLSIDSANQRIGPARIRNEGGRYHITVDDPRLRVDLQLAPDNGFYLPAEEIAGDSVVSGYVVPAVRGRMSGYLHTAQSDVRLEQAPGYHDHNWGTWRGVSWEWGEASGAGGAVLYGALHLPEGPSRTPSGRAPVLFVWESSREGTAGGGGFLGPLPVRAIEYAGWHPGPLLRGHRVRVPAAVTINAGSGTDHVMVTVQVQDALASAAPEINSTAQRSGPPKPPATAFLQLRGVAEVRGAVDGHVVMFSGGAAAETFVPLR